MASAEQAQCPPYKPSGIEDFSGALALEPHHDVDARDLIAVEHLWQIADAHARRGNVDQRVLAFDKEMVVIRRIGVEISLGTINRDLAQQPNVGELVERVVDGRKLDRHAGVACFHEQHLGREVTIPLGEQEPAQFHALARRPEANFSQHGAYVVPRAAVVFGTRAVCPDEGSTHFIRGQGSTRLHRFYAVSLGALSL